MRKILYLLVLWFFAELCLGLGLYLKLHLGPKQLSDKTFTRQSLYISDHPYLPYLPKTGQYHNIRFAPSGARGSKPEIAKTRYRILVLGGSHVFEEEFKLQQTWPALLEQELGVDEYEVINAAQNGATTADTLINYQLIQSEYNPDLIIVYHAVNDLESAYRPGFRSDYAHNRKNIGSIAYPFFLWLPTFLDYLPSFSILRYQLLGNTKEIWHRFTRQPFEQDFTKTPTQGFAIFERNLHFLNLIARDQGAEILYLGFVYSKMAMAKAEEEDVALAWEKGIKVHDKIVRDFARQDKIHYFDLKPHIPLNKDFLRDCCHFTYRGNQQIAKVLSTSIKKIVKGKNE